MKKILRNFLHLFFPNLCLVCSSKLGDGETHICIGCLSVLPKTNYHKQTDNRLENFFAGRFPFERIAAYAYFVKDGSIQRIVHELKYKRNPDVGVFAGRLCGENIKGSDFATPIDVIVPVPLHPKRQKQRGYNQSEEICKGMSEVLNIPVNKTSLARTVNNPSQTKSSRFDRWENVDGIFELKDLNAFADKHVMLVDDIITTGSTLEACAKEILKSTNCTVSIFAFGTAN